MHQRGVFGAMIFKTLEKREQKSSQNTDTPSNKKCWKAFLKKKNWYDHDLDTTQQLAFIRQKEKKALSQFEELNNSD